MFLVFFPQISRQILKREIEELKRRKKKKLILVILGGRLAIGRYPVSNLDRRHQDIKARPMLVLGAGWKFSLFVLVERQEGKGGGKKREAAGQLAKAGFCTLFLCLLRFLEKACSHAGEDVQLRTVIRSTDKKNKINKKKKEENKELYKKQKTRKNVKARSEIKLPLTSTHQQNFLCSPSISI